MRRRCMSVAVTVASGRLPQGSVTLPREVAGWSVGVGLYTPTAAVILRAGSFGVQYRSCILRWLARGNNSFLFQEAFPRSSVRSTLKCPVFIAHDLSGFAFPSALTEGARRATEVSAENRRAPSPQVTPCLVLDRSLGFRAGNPSAEKAATRCGP